MPRAPMIFSNMANLSMRFLSWRKGRMVGVDEFGNRYYESRKSWGDDPRPRRWVIYKGEPEPSAVPPEWHGWLHKQVEGLPEQACAPYRQPWIKPYRPNPTGTPDLYLPPGHTLRGGRRGPATGDYEAWTPEMPEER